MSSIAYRLAIFLLVASALVACGSSQDELDGQDSQVADAFEAQTAEARETSSAAAGATNEARATQVRGTEVAVQSAATSEAAVSARQTAEANDRLATEEAAAEARALGTAQAKAMNDLVQDLNTEGYLTGTDGIYYDLEDFDESWAQIDWYQWWGTGYSPTDFVIRADASWESASDKANWWTSGCGFVFREDGVSDHYLAYLGLDGNVYFTRNVGNIPAFLGSSYYGKVDTPNGQAQIMLVVEGTTMTFFVNGERVHTRQDQGLEKGNLAFTLLSGINLDFGTRCTMTNIELWELAQGR